MTGADGLRRAGHDPVGAARHAADSDTFRRLARVGHVANGILHLVLGVLAWNLALGGSSQPADQSGAAALLVGNPFGLVLLWITVAGCALLGLWHLLAAGRGGEKASRRLTSAGKGVAFAAVGLTFASTATGAGQDSGQATASLTATLMSYPAGALLVGAVGLAVIAVGVHHVHKGVTRRFTRDLASPSRRELSRAVVVSGVAGYAAKGLVLGVVGVLFIVAAVRNDPSDSTGLDGALRTLLEQPAGPWLAAAVGVGLMLHGVHQVLRSRYDRTLD